ncbi:MAG: DM13 domain-containing protein [Anaerolineales bacterium]
MAIRKPILIAVIVIGLALALPVGWYLVSPLFINQVVDEALPTAAPVASETGQPATGDTALMAATGTAAAMSTVAMATMEMATAAMATEMGATEAFATAMAANATATELPVAATDVPTTTVLAQGLFYNVVHEGHGQATVYQFADGSRVLRLDDFEVLNGPELHVYLAPVDPVQPVVGADIDGALDLGQLKGNIGSQNYDLPAGLDLAQYRSVIIWCQPFKVPFIAAPLAAN